MTGKGKLQTALLALIGMLILIPIAIVLLSSFKSRLDILAIPPTYWFEPTFQNYGSILGGEASQPLWNSLVIASISSIVAISLSIPAGYTFSRISKRYLESYFIGVMTVRMVPAVVIILPLYFIFSFLHILDSYIGIIVINTAINIPVATWLSKMIFDETPTAIDEAASIDGARTFQVLKDHLIPINFYQLAMVFVVCFVLAWNEFFLGMVLTSHQKRPLTVEASSLLTPHGTNWGELSAIMAVCLIPILLLIAGLMRINHAKNNGE